MRVRILAWRVGKDFEGVGDGVGGVAVGSGSWQVVTLEIFARIELVNS